MVTRKQRTQAELLAAKVMWETRRAARSQPRLIIPDAVKREAQKRLGWRFR